ncbi:unnamed protein product [Rhizoctonia solani]|uniref:Uncharacterized protein n=1 Tax=Rhizoctonia solani TaxID=456999 RepID=A0A8H3B0A7_9AGAM|nr:unnamed protein product [Rhizoctonia solani]
MALVSFTGLRTPCAQTGVFSRFASRDPHWYRGFKSFNSPQGTFCRFATHVKGIPTQVSPLNSTYKPKHQSILNSSFGLAGLPDSFHRLQDISYSAVTTCCPTRAFGVLNIPARLKPSKVVILVRAYSTDESKTDADPNSTKKPPPEELRTYLEAFFAKYPGFEYDPTKPCMSEFKRLTEWAGWEKGSDEFKEARKGMNEALTDQFNAIYGKDPNDIAALRNLCSVLELAEIPTERSACKKLIKSLFINIVDLVDQPVTNVRVGYFRTEGRLAWYTREHEKFYSLQAAKAGGLLKLLLRFIEQPRRKTISKPKLRKS